MPFRQTGKNSRAIKASNSIYQKNSVDSHQECKNLRVLITNNTLAGRGGSETYVLDLCKQLLVSGHHPVAYSASHGQTAEDIRRLGATVIDSLEDMAAPDIIHGHHHLDTTYAMLSFPNTPCVYFCHGITPWEELPAARLSSIMRYVAISERVKYHLTNNRVPEEKISIIPNFVDSSRFRPFSDFLEYRSSRKPEQAGGPKRALMFGNYNNKFIDTITQACQQSGYTLDCIGLPWENNTSTPELVIPEYDVIFCYGKSALESLYSGCHVILSSINGIGATIDQSNFEALRKRNFGSTLCHGRPDLSTLSLVLDRIKEDRSEGKRPITSAQRDSLSSEFAIKKIIQCYNRAIQEFSLRNTGESESKDIAELATYIQFLQKSRHNQGINFQVAESIELLQARHEIIGLASDRDSLIRQNAELDFKLISATKEAAEAGCFERKLQWNRQVLGNAKSIIRIQGKFIKRLILILTNLGQNRRHALLGKALKNKQ